MSAPQTKKAVSGVSILPVPTPPKTAKISGVDLPRRLPNGPRRPSNPEKLIRESKRGSKRYCKEKKRKKSIPIQGERYGSQCRNDRFN
jgi:hypothetical protein